jgi:hypothetical protein
MQLFMLRPVRPEAPLWQTSRYAGPCFVNADSECAARSAVSRCFAQVSAWSPWDSADLTSCAPVRGLDRIPPEPDVVMVPSRVAFGGWRAVPVPPQPERLRRSA